jgi:hypothetical protein
MAIGVVILLVLAGVAVWVLVASLFLLWGARLVDIPGRSLGKAVGAVILGTIACSVLSAVLSAAPVVGTSLGVIGAFLVEALVIMPVFNTTFGKALGASVLSWALSLLVFGGLALAVILVLLVLGVSLAMA